VPYRGFRTIFMYVYTGASGDRCVYMGEMKGRHIYLENHIVPRSYNISYFSKFVCSIISLSGSLSLLREP
jgi:hypothetical protein